MRPGLTFDRGNGIINSKKKSGLPEKRKEVYNHGIFNEDAA